MSINKFHFKEIDWIIYFPSTGNEGRELADYGVAYRDRINKKTQPGPKINLSNVLTQNSIKNRYPHNVGLFNESVGRGLKWTPKYIEIRPVKDKKELLKWFKSCIQKQDSSSNK